ncbi:MAG: M56 family metallopeptidase [Holophaga sp.]
MNDLLLHPTLVRLGLTALHSLWQVLALGLLAWAGLAMLQRQRSDLRYAFACSALVLMVLAPLFTFFWIGPELADSAPTVLQVEGGTLALSPLLSTGGLHGWMLRANGWAPWLAIFWAAGTGTMMLRLAGGVWWLDRAYLAQAQRVSESWQATLDSLSRRMGFKSAVPLLESQKADTPLVIGWFKPVILIPTSALLHLSPQALEAVLAHELAHIRRLDYLANLLQCLAEAFLFFHPAAWWLSRQIRELREHCCDDAAAALCGDPMILAEGLSTLERLRRSLHSNPEPALAAAQGKLMFRITRLFRPQEVQAPSLRGLAMTLVGVSLIGAVALTAQQATAAKKAPSTAAKAPAPSLRIAYQPPPPPYPAEARAKNIQGLVVLRLHVDGSGIPNRVEVMQGPQELHATATAYAQGWRFKAAASKGKTADQVFQLNLLFSLKGDKTSATPMPTIPSTKGPSATMEILARAVSTEAPTSAQGVAEFDFSRIKVAFQPKPPAYPVDAKAKRIQGTVVISITIDEQGMPQSVEALEGPEELRSTATDYAKDWRFEPAQLNGKPIKARFKLTMPFKLR